MWFRGGGTEEIFSKRGRQALANISIPSVADKKSIRRR